MGWRNTFEPASRALASGGRRARTTRVKGSEWRPLHTTAQFWVVPRSLFRPEAGKPASGFFYSFLQKGVIGMEVLATKFDAAVVGRNNRAVTLHGMVHALRDLGGVTFLTLRTREGLVQCVCPRRPEGVREECAVSVSGLLRPEPRAPGGAELAEARCTVLSRPAAPGVRAGVSRRQRRRTPHAPPQDAGDRRTGSAPPGCAG